MERRETENGRTKRNAGRPILDRDQVLALMQAAPLELVKLIVLTYGLGARLCEAVAFQPEQINSARCEITIRSVSGPERRVFWVGPEVVAVLSAPSPPSGIDPRILLRKAAEKAGLGAVTFHDLKSSFIVSMVAAGESIGEVWRIVGGHHQSSVESVYGHLLFRPFDLRGRIPILVPVNSSAQPEMLRQAN